MYHCEENYCFYAQKVRMRSTSLCSCAQCRPGRLGAFDEWDELCASELVGFSDARSRRRDSVYVGPSSTRRLGRVRSCPSGGVLAWTVSTIEKCFHFFEHVEVTWLVVVAVKSEGRVVTKSTAQRSQIYEDNQVLRSRKWIPKSLWSTLRDVDEANTIHKLTLLFTTWYEKWSRLYNCMLTVIWCKRNASLHFCLLLWLHPNPTVFSSKRPLHFFLHWWLQYKKSVFEKADSWSRAVKCRSRRTSERYCSVWFRWMG